MSAPFKPYEPDQSLLFPPNLQDWLPREHLAYFVMDVVETLDLSRIYAFYDFKEEKDEEGRVVGQQAKTNRGRPAYHPQMMTGLLLYGYATGSPSSRQIEKKCVEDVAFRVISGDQKPDHATIAEFRKVHLEALDELFIQVLKLCQKAGLVKLGHVALDGTKVKANASKHKAMSYGRMLKKEEELRREVRELLRRAQEVDDAEDKLYGKGKRGDELPEELARRESRLKKLQEAKEALEAEAKAAAEEKRRKQEEDEQQREEDGKPKKPGRKAEISEVPKDKAQRNFTDPESRIMKNSDKAFIQGYNAQAAVDHENQVIVAADVSAMAPDTPHLKPMMARVERNTGRNPTQLSADAGYFSQENVDDLEGRGIEALVTPKRIKHGDKTEAPRGRIPIEPAEDRRLPGCSHLSNRRGSRRHVRVPWPGRRSQLAALHLRASVVPAVPPGRGHGSVVPGARAAGEVTGRIQDRASDR